MRRRDFVTRLVTRLGGLVAAASVLWPLAAGAQQAAMPIVGLLRSTPAASFADIVTALQAGLAETGFVAGRNVTIEQRWADNQAERLPGLAAELVKQRAAVVVGNHQAVMAMKSVTATMPIVFVTGEDPVKIGLVASLGRPGGNLTGVTFFAGSQLNTKRLELLHELVPQVSVVGVLGDPGYSAFEPELPDLQAAARAMGLSCVVERAANAAAFEPAFARIAQSGAGAVLVSGSPFFTSEREVIVGLAARHAIPAIYDLRNLVAVGGLISYSSSFNGAYRQAGVYAGQILKGAKPSELPVQQATTFELSINLKTAKALKLTVPPSLLARADEVIE
jgi:putative ABC transport system substrate-binding protein